MEELLAALGHPVRLWIVRQLLRQGPLRQKELLDLARAAQLRAVMSDGSFSNVLKPLLSCRLVVRDTPRGPLYLAHRNQTAQLLAAASALSLASLGEAQKASEQTHRALMRDVLEARAEISGDETGDPSVSP